VSAAKHTPGPWQMKANRASFGVYTPVGDLVVRVETSNYAGERKRADATLIAAAPSMLEALTSIVEQFEAYAITNTSATTHDATGFIYAKARAAIAQATGGDS
jgi:hypothetical protein